MQKKGQWLRIRFRKQQPPQQQQSKRQNGAAIVVLMMMMTMMRQHFSTVSAAAAATAERLPRQQQRRWQWAPPPFNRQSTQLPPVLLCKRDGWYSSEKQLQANSSEKQLQANIHKKMRDGKWKNTCSASLRLPRWVVKPSATKAAFVGPHPHSLKQQRCRYNYSSLPPRFLDGRKKTRLFTSSAATATPEEQSMTEDCRRIFDAAVAAVDPRTAVRKHFQLDTANQRMAVLHVGQPQPNDDVVVQQQQQQTSPPTLPTNQLGRSYNLHSYERIVVVAFGKASAAMATTVLDCLLEAAASDGDDRAGQNINIAGVVIVKDGHVTKAQEAYLTGHNIAVRQASHPVPDERNVRASFELLTLVKETCAPPHHPTLVVACLSGGGSALFCTPVAGLSLPDLRATHTALLQTGWDIRAVNTVRKILERGKGGGLAVAATGKGADVVSLILSDVIGDPLDLIASGPTVLPADPTETRNAIEQAWKLVTHQLPEHIQFPAAVMKILNEEYEISCSERNVGSGDSDRGDAMSSIITSDRCFNCLVGNNAMAIQAAATRAAELGYHPVILGTQLQGEATTVAQVLVGLAQHVQQGSTEYNLSGGKNNFPIALVAGGETTVSLPSSAGKGGRNQELALAAALALRASRVRQVVVASVGTDGSDGPTDASGAVVDGGTVDRLDAVASAATSKDTAVQALQRHNAYPYLDLKDETGHSPLLKVRQTALSPTF